MPTPNPLERLAVAGTVVEAQAASTGQVVAAQASVQLSGAGALEVNALTQLIVTSTGATSAACSTLQITGLSTQQISGATLTLMFGVPAGAGVPAVPLVVNFEPPLLSKIGTNIKAELPSMGAGHAGLCINLLGKVIRATGSN